MIKVNGYDKRTAPLPPGSQVYKTYIPDFHATGFLTPVTPSWKNIRLMQHHLKLRFWAVKNNFILKTNLFMKVRYLNYQIRCQYTEFRLVLVKGTITPINSTRLIIYFSCLKQQTCSKYFTPIKCIINPHPLERFIISSNSSQNTHLNNFWSTFFISS